MFERVGWRIATGTGVLTTAVLLAGCTSGSEEIAAPVAAPPPSGAIPPDAAPRNTFQEGEEPTEVATDSPVTPAPDGAAEVLVTYAEWNPAAGQLEIGAFVEGVAESGGTCTVTVSRDGDSVSATAPGEPDAVSTGCLGLTVPGDGLTPGTWTAVVDYESDERAGTSDPVEVIVP